MATPKRPRNIRTAHPPFLSGESEEITFLRLKMGDATKQVFPKAEVTSITVETDSPLLEGKKEDLHAVVGVRMPHTVAVDDLDRYHKAFNRALSKFIPKSLSLRIRTTVLIFTPSYFFSINEVTYPILLKIAETNEKLAAKILSASAKKKAEKEKKKLLDELVSTGHAINTFVIDNSNYNDD